MVDQDSCFVMPASHEFDRLVGMGIMQILAIQEKLGVVDNGFKDKEDMVERIILTQKKNHRLSHNPFGKFAEMKSDVDTKSCLLIDMMRRLHEIFSGISSGPLSEVLLEERLLKRPDLLAEFGARICALVEKELLVIIAGETNGGKSTFLNLILGVKVLPTDVLHCTLAITKIKYSETYSIETLDHSGVTETHQCQGAQDAHDRLKYLVARENQIARLEGSKYKEITLKLPALILKSGVTLVDTPGIGEMEEMDNVTMNYIKSTRAAGFIYIIKSDTAGGVQEDRLVSFLRAIQEDFKKDTVEGAIDPRVALFICNRWDEISKEGEEIVKKNALTKLDIVWPGFKTEQAHFFSSKKAQLHIDADPEFVTDKLNDLFIGMNKLFNRAAENHIKHQYSWTKAILQPASRHLSAMINHCISSNEELEELFRTVAYKQEILIKKSNEKCPDLKQMLTPFKLKLKAEVFRIFSSIQVEEMEDYDQLTAILTETYLEDNKNKREADQWIVNSLIRHCDSIMHISGILEDMEKEAKLKIEEHMGLFQAQMKEITKLVKGNTFGGAKNKRVSYYGSSVGSTESSTSESSVSDLFDRNTMNPSLLTNAVENFLQKKKKAKKIWAMVPNFKRKMMSKVNSEMDTMGGNGGDSHKSVTDYLGKRILKLACSMRENDEIVEGFAVGYLHLIELYIQSTIDHIPHFIGVNNKLMDNIREHRKVLQDDKAAMKTVMDQLEPHRERFRGYGCLYMEDVMADDVIMNTGRRGSCVAISKQMLGVSTTLGDSGFVDCGSTGSEVRGFWTHLKHAVIKVDDEPMDVTLKTNTTQIDTNTQLLDISSLRYLGHKNLASFYGMTRLASSSEDTKSSEKISAFIFKGYLVSARFFKKKTLKSMKEFLKTFVHELISGLEYMHRENIVHLELNLDTVMVDFLTGTVQLCHQCKPRAIQLPSDLSIQTKSSVCLSPPVLGGCEYGISDDIYAFVLLLWELLFPNNLPYAEQRKWTLKDFIKDVCPKKMLGPQIDKLEASEGIINVFKDAFLTGRRSHSLTLSDIKSVLYDGNDYSAFSQTTPRRQPVRTPSKGNGEDPGYRCPEDETEQKASKTSPNPLPKYEAPGPPPIRPPRLKKKKQKDDVQRSVTFSSDESASTTDNTKDCRRKLSVPAIKIQDQIKLQLMYEDMQHAKMAEKSNHDSSSDEETSEAIDLETRGRRKFSVPELLINDQKKLLSSYRENYHAEFEDENTLATEDITSTQERNNHRYRRMSAPTINLNDQKKLQKQAEAHDKAKFKKLWKFMFGKQHLKKQKQCDETDLLSQKKMYSSLPENMNSIPLPQTREKKKKNLLPKFHKKERRPSSGQFFPDSGTADMLRHGSSSLTASPKLKHGWARNSIISNSSMETEEEEEKEGNANTRRSQSRSSSTSLYSPFVARIMERRIQSAPQDIYTVGDDKEFQEQKTEMYGDSNVHARFDIGSSEVMSSSISSNVLSSSALPPLDGASNNVSQGALPSLNSSGSFDVSTSEDDVNSSTRGALSHINGSESGFNNIDPIPSTVGVKEEVRSALPNFGDGISVSEASRSTSSFRSDFATSDAFPLHMSSSGYFSDAESSRSCVSHVESRTARTPSDILPTLCLEEMSFLDKDQQADLGAF